MLSFRERVLRTFARLREIGRELGELEPKANNELSRSHVDALSESKMSLVIDSETDQVKQQKLSSEADSIRKETIWNLH